MLGSISLTKGGTVYIIIILVVLFMLAFQLVGGAPQENPQLVTTGTTYKPIIETNSIGAQNSLQLKELQFTSPGNQSDQSSSSVPLPNLPPMNSPRNNSTSQEELGLGTPHTDTSTPKPATGPVHCTAAQEAQVVKDASHNCGPPVKDVSSPEGAARRHCLIETTQTAAQGLGCTVGKPVIYLYPTKPTYVNVSLKIPGIITESIPTYPENGWQNVLASPGGTLTYQNSVYHELYYESAVGGVKAPSTGVVIPVSDLQTKLTTLTSRLGLLHKEQQEFLDYWLPKLEDLHTPYILFSIIDPAEKERIDHIEITPKPDTMIEFLVYFRPLQTDVAPVAPLVLPNPPERRGFTAVEWGGTIGY